MKKDPTTTNDSNAVRPVAPEEVYANSEQVMNVAKRLGWDYDSSKDLVQELAIKCWNDPRVRFNPSKGTLVGYLKRIARNMAVDMWRKNKHLPIPMEDAELVARKNAEVQEGGNTELQEERIKLLKRGIGEMYRRFPSKQGIDAFVMFSLEGKSAKQVAQELGIEERFVNVAVHRGMERLTNIVRNMAMDENWNEAC